MLRPAPRPHVRPEPSVGIHRRRSVEAIEITEKTESEFRSYITQFERESLFMALRERGHIAKIGLKGRIPRQAYDEHADVEMIRLIRRQKISDVPGWFEELSSVEAVRRPDLFVAKYGVDAAIIRRVARYLRRLDYDEVDPDARVGGAELELDEVADPGAEPTDSGEKDPTEICSRFVRRHGLQAHDFAADFLRRELDAASLAKRYAAPVAEVEQVLAAIERVQVFEAFAATTRKTTKTRTVTYSHPITGDSPHYELVAAVERDDDTGIPMLTVDPDDVYAETYHITREGVKALYEIADNEKEAERLLSRLRLINQRKSLLHRLVSAIFRAQFNYFATGDENLLRPLTQANLALALKEDESTICRLIRNKALRFLNESRPLKWHCQRKTDVIGRILAQQSGLSDGEAARILRERYGCNISRRTVNYHRAKLDQRPMDV